MKMRIIPPEEIRRDRLVVGDTQREAANRIGFTDRYWWRIERPQGHKEHSVANTRLHADYLLLTRQISLARWRKYPYE